MKHLTKKRKTEIANEVLATAVEFDGQHLCHLKPVVRQLLIEAIEKALAEAQDSANSAPAAYAGEETP